MNAFIASAANDSINDADTSDANATAQYIEDAARYDGSRTSPQKTMTVMLLAREGRSQTAIAKILGMNDRTVKAILAREDSIIADGRMLLKSNTLGFVSDAIKASSVAAEKGKLEGISGMLDRLGVTEPPKSQQASQVAVQVVLNGGAAPLELSPAKPEADSETPSEVPVNGVGLISHPMSTAQLPPHQALTETSVLQAGAQEPEIVGLS
jgi:hypothetical protein